VISALSALYLVLLSVLVAGQARRVVHALRDQEAGWSRTPYERTMTPLKYWAFLAFEVGLLGFVASFLLGTIIGLVR
jgi:hypothetical protein